MCLATGELRSFSGRTVDRALLPPGNSVTTAAGICRPRFAAASQPRQKHPDSERHDRPCRCGHLIPCRRIPGISQALTPISWSWPPPCTRTTSPAPPDAARLGPKRPRWCEPWELPASRRPRHARALSPIAAPLVARLAYPVLRASPCRLPGGTACVRARVQIACVGALLFLHLSFSDGYAAFRILCFFWPASPARKKSFGSVPEAECNPDGSPLLQVSCLCRPSPPCPNGRWKGTSGGLNAVKTTHFDVIPPQFSSRTALKRRPGPN